MDTITTTCSECGKVGKAPEAALGCLVKCRECGAAFVMKATPHASTDAIDTNADRRARGEITLKPYLDRNDDARDDAAVDAIADILHALELPVSELDDVIRNAFAEYADEAGIARDARPFWVHAQDRDV